jgi:hypothetical protein
MKRLLIGLSVSVAVIGVVAGVTLGIRTLLGVTFEESEPKPAEGIEANTEEASGPASAHEQVARYPGFSFCVEAIGVDAAVEAVGKANIETALLEVVQHQYWNLLRPGSPPPLVDLGCPSEPLIARPGVDWDGPNFASRGSLLHHYDVTEPSFYWTFIFIMPVEEISKVMSGLSVRIAPQEYVNEGDAGRLVTTAMFFSPEELGDTSFPVKQLLIAVGLESLYPESEFPDRSHR